MSKKGNKRLEKRKTEQIISKLHKIFKNMIQFEKIDGVGKITLNRPEKYHSFVREMALKLQETLDICEKNDEIRSVMITKWESIFAGQDLTEATDPNGINISTIIQEHYNPIILKIRNLNKPVICC